MLSTTPALIATTPTVTCCAECPFARHLDRDRHVCTSASAAVGEVRGHWEPRPDCLELQATLELLTEIETYKANLANPMWIKAWYANPDNWIFEGEEVIGVCDPEPLLSKFPFLRPGYNNQLNEI